jgi:hypothetical protein
MTTTTTLTEAEKRLLTGSKSYFFESCFSEFGFLATAGFRRSFGDHGRNLYLVSFVKEDALSGFTVRIYHEDDDLLWCDLVCVSNDEIRVRLAGQVDFLGVIAPEERLEDGPIPEAVHRRVHDLAVILRGRSAEFHDRLLFALREKKEPNQPPQTTTGSSAPDRV